MRLKLMKKICKICNFQTINYPNSPETAFSLNDEELTDRFPIKLSDISRYSIKTNNDEINKHN